MRPAALDAHGQASEGSLKHRILCLKPTRKRFERGPGAGKMGGLGVTGGFAEPEDCGRQICTAVQCNPFLRSRTFVAPCLMRREDNAGGGGLGPKKMCTKNGPIRFSPL